MDSDRLDPGATANPAPGWKGAGERAAAQFRHQSGKDVHAPGFYLHLEPGNVFVGAGSWRPDREAVDLIRGAIALGKAAKASGSPQGRQISFADGMAALPAGIAESFDIDTGTLTLGGDVLKGALPVYFAMRLLPETVPGREVYLGLVALAAFSGHLYPIYLGFKDGGKGVATAAGCFLILSPAATGIVLVIFILFAGIVNRV